MGIGDSKGRIVGTHGTSIRRERTQTGDVFGSYVTSDNFELSVSRNKLAIRVAQERQGRIDKKRIITQYVTIYIPRERVDDLLTELNRMICAQAGTGVPKEKTQKGKGDQK